MPYFVTVEIADDATEQERDLIAEAVAVAAHNSQPPIRTWEVIVIGSDTDRA